MKNIIVVALALLLGANVSALERKSISQVDKDELMAETQKMPSSEGHIALVWWLPFEFWQTSFTGDTTTSQADLQAMLNTMQPYFIVAVVQADISTYGAFAYYAKDAVEKNMKIEYMDDKGQRLQLDPTQNPDPDLEMLLGMFKPILAAAMGNLGDNFHFYVYSDRNNAGARTVDPYAQGKLIVRLAKSDGESLEAEIETPLGSLYVPRKCPNGRDAHISWKYCPWTGKPLPE